MDRFVLCVGIAVLALCAWGCGGDEPATTPGAAPAWKTIARAKAAALFAEERFPEARKALDTLLQDAPDGEDLVRAGVAEIWIGAPDSYTNAMALFQRALKIAPNDPAVHYNLAKLYERGQTDQALFHMQKANELAPDDYPTMLALAGLLEQADRRDEAVALYEKLKAIGVENAGSWHLITLYQLGQIRVREGKRDEGQKLFAERADLTNRGITVPSGDESARGNFGTLLPPPAGGNKLSRPTAPEVTVREGSGVLAGYASVRAVTLVDDWRHEDAGCVVHPPDLVAWGQPGLAVARTDDGKSYKGSVIHEGQVNELATLDLNNDGAIDFVLATTVGITILMAEKDGASWTKAAFEFPSVPAPPADMEPVDFDHDGDIDLLLVGAFGARLWRNDGLVVDGGRLSDASKDASLPQDMKFLWCAIEDMDTDQDVDLLMGSDAGTVLMDNLRRGRFVMRIPGYAKGKARPLLADFRGDGRPEFTTNDGFVTDWDLDGAADFVWTPERGAVSGQLALGRPASITLGAGGPYGASSAFGDTDGDRLPDQVELLAEQLRFTRVQRGENAGFLLALRGVKSNARGVGAIVEVRAGPIYRRIFWRGEPELIGLGTQPQADVVRVTWPNGVVQHELDVKANDALFIEQSEGLVGSCPFLYTWNGEEYVYISDVLGITPMGLPIAPGMMVPPDHDEYVRVTGEQMKPKTLEDGRQVYEMQFTEELREVTYLDRAKLLVIDHPADTEMFPTERFAFPPFPKHRINVVKPVAPTRVLGSDGKDWTKHLARIDEDYAAPFTPHRGQFQGLANPHWLELHFDPALVKDAKELRLLFTGWFFWTDASVNMAVARTPGIDFVPPILQVPLQQNGTEGPEALSERSESKGWKNTGPPVGFPAGKTKTMVIDVSKILNRDDPRIRVFSTLRLYWDAIRIAVGPNHKYSTTVLEPKSAWLWERGFSKPIPTFGNHQLEWFDWNVMDEPRWNQHPGMYTKHGEVLPLLQQIDDHFVIMGAGDALRIRFDASMASKRPDGWRRDFLVFMDGWAKDRDHNTHEALFVEPLPFHGMKGYPYPPDQAYPDTPETRAYRDRWNTRPSKTWVPSLAPRRR